MRVQLGRHKAEMGMHNSRTYRGSKSVTAAAGWLKHTWVLIKPRNTLKRENNRLLPLDHERDFGTLCAAGRGMRKEAEVRFEGSVFRSKW